MRSMAMATTMRMIMTMMLKRWMRTMMIMILIKRRCYDYAWSSSLPSSRSMTLLSTIQQQNTFDQIICKSLFISLLKIFIHLHISLNNVVNDGKTPKLFRQEAPISEFCWKPAKMIILLKGTSYRSKVIVLVGWSDHWKHERAINITQTDHKIKLKKHITSCADASEGEWELRKEGGGGGEGWEQGRARWCWSGRGCRWPPGWGRRTWSGRTQRTTCTFQPTFRGSLWYTHFFFRFRTFFPKTFATKRGQRMTGRA